METILLKDFLKFLIKPEFKLDTVKYSFSQKLVKLIRLFSWVMLINIGFAIVLEVGMLVFKLSAKNIITDALKNTPLYLTIFGVFIAPILEETIFRLPLKFKPIYLALSVFIIGIEIARKFFAVGDNALFNMILVICVALFLSLIFYVAFSTKSIAGKASNFYQKHFRFLFYLSVLTFGYIHLSNFENLSSIWFLIPILPFAQVCAGMFLGYVRSNYGFWWGVLMHILNNSLLIPITALMLLPMNLQIIVALFILCFGLLFLLFGLLNLLLDVVSILAKKDILSKLKVKIKVG